MATDKPMQLGMVGLGRMGANLVRRLMRDGHHCVVNDINASAVQGPRRRGRHRAPPTSPRSSNMLERPRAIWLMIPAGLVQPTLDKLRPLVDADDIIIDGGNSYYRDDIIRAKALEPDGIHYIDCGTSGGVWGLERGFCLMIGGEEEPVERLDPIFKTIAPGKGDAQPTPSRTQDRSTAAEGYLHCGPNGAGHFVKMVHNGIEYGMMAAIAEGLSIIGHADAGDHMDEVDAETTPLRDPWAYQYKIDVGEVAEAVAARVGDQLLADRPDRRRLRQVPGPQRLHRPGVRLRRGPLDRSGRHRHRGAGRRHHRRALRAVRVPRRWRVHRQGTIRHALRIRRSPGEEGGLSR